jgi:hypothetical protein
MEFETYYLIMNGPCADNGNLRGISVYKAASLAEAQALPHRIRW